MVSKPTQLSSTFAILYNWYKSIPDFYTLIPENTMASIDASVKDIAELHVFTMVTPSTDKQRALAFGFKYT